MTILESIQKNARTARWVGIFMLIAGFLSLLSPFASGLSVTVIIGVLLVMSGIAQLLVVFQAGSFGKGLLLALLGILSVAAGGYMIFQPAVGLMTLTLFLASYFVAMGILEIIAAFGARPADGWGWLIFGGIVSLILGFMIWRQFPLSGVWAVGILVGVRLILSGWELIAIGGAVKRGTKAVSEATSA